MFTLVQAAACGDVIAFKDLSRSHLAYDSVCNIVNVYEIMSGFDDFTFRGQEDVSRFQFAALLVNSMVYLERISGRDLSRKVATPETFNDVLPQHWAYKSVDVVVNKYQIMGGYGEGVFDGYKPLSRLELATILGRSLFRIEGRERYTINPYFEDIDRRHWAFKYTQKLVDAKMLLGEGKFNGKEPVSRYEAAVALDLFIQKLAAGLQVSLPSQVKSSLVYPDINFSIEGRWGGVSEPVSQTSNWTLYLFGLDFVRPLSIGGREASLDIKLEFGSNKMVYLTTSSYTIVLENRSFARLLLEFYQSPAAAWLLGLEYLSLRNSFSPSSFLGFVLGAKTRLAVPFGLTPEIKATYALPLSPAETVSSRVGPPRGRLHLELKQGFSLFELSPIFVYSFEDLLMGESGQPRLYNSFGLRFKL